MTPFLEIFTKKRKIKKPIKIIIDYREKNSLVASELVKLGFDIQFTNLKVGDYLVNDVAIERKTISDFISSMINKRLINQIQELKQYKNRLLIIEGIEEQELYNDENSGMNGNSIRGFLLSILLKHKIPIIFSKNSEDTAIFISLIAKKKEHEEGIRPQKRTFNKKEQMQFILEGFPGIGPKTAKRLLSHFKSLKAIADASQSEIHAVIGKKAEVFKLFDERY